MSLMTKDVWDILTTSKAPHPGLEFQPVEYETHIAVRLFRENFEEFSDPQREDLAVWIGSLVNRIRALGIPCYIEAVKSKEDKTGL